MCSFIIIDSVEELTGTQEDTSTQDSEGQSLGQSQGFNARQYKVEFNMNLHVE